MKLLGNSLHGIIPTQKCLLYRCCILPIALYGFQLWFYNHTPLLYLLKILGKMQRRAAIWILEAFKTSPVEGIEVIAGLIPIKLHLQKLVSRSQLHLLMLPHNYLIRSLMDSPSSLPKYQYPTLLSTLTDHQRSLIKGYLVDSNNKLYEIFPSFSSLYLELSLGSRIIDNFSDCFSFNLSNKEKMIKSTSNSLTIWF